MDYLHTWPMSERLEFLRAITTALGGVLESVRRESAGGSTIPPGDRRRSAAGRHVVLGIAAAGILLAETVLVLTLLDLLEQTVELVELWSELGALQLEIELDRYL